MLQREKQQKLNELDVVVVLRLQQIQYMLNSALPQDLSQCLVFNSPGLVRLQHRINELEKEKAEQKRLYRYLNVFLFHRQGLRSHLARSAWTAREFPRPANSIVWPIYISMFLCIDISVGFLNDVIKRHTWSVF